MVDKMMSATEIIDPIAFFADRGFLHDAEILNIACKITESSVEIEINDLNAAFFELPNYGSAQMGILRFSNATALYTNIDFTDGVTISKAYSSRIEGGFICDLQLRYGGTVGNVNGASVRIDFEKLSFAVLG
jgi:hypothetical protein